MINNQIIYHILPYISDKSKPNWCSLNGYAKNIIIYVLIVKSASLSRVNITKIATVILCWDRYDRNIWYSCAIFCFRKIKKKKKKPCSCLHIHWHLLITSLRGGGKWEQIPSNHSYILLLVQIPVRVNWIELHPNPKHQLKNYSSLIIYLTMMPTYIRSHLPIDLYLK